jgi:spore coat protein CotF
MMGRKSAKVEAAAKQQSNSPNVNSLDSSKVTSLTKSKYYLKKCIHHKSFYFLINNLWFTTISQLDTEYEDISDI